MSLADLSPLARPRSWNSSCLNSTSRKYAFNGENTHIRVQLQPQTHTNTHIHIHTHAHTHTRSSTPIRTQAHTFTHADINEKHTVYTLKVTKYDDSGSPHFLINKFATSFSFLYFFNMEHFSMQDN